MNAITKSRGYGPGLLADKYTVRDCPDLAMFEVTTPLGRMCVSYEVARTARAAIEHARKVRVLQAPA